MPAHRPKSPAWFVVCESASWRYDDPKYLAQQARVAARALGMDETQSTWLRIATIIIEGLPDLIGCGPPGPRCAAGICWRDQTVDRRRSCDNNGNQSREGGRRVCLKLDVRSIRGLAPGDRLSDDIDQLPDEPETQQHPLDSDKMRREHRQMLEWWYLEREKQSANRLRNGDRRRFYDNYQWDNEDSAAVIDRGQMPLVHNEIAPAVDWLIGTERRTRADWKVLPRTEDDVSGADVKPSS